MTHDFSDLEALLEESKDHSRRKAAVEAQRKELTKLSNSGANAEDIAKAREVIHRWESQHEWKTIARTAVFLEEQCSCCGGTVRTFSHWMLQQVHREVLSRTRYIRASPEVIAESIVSANLPHPSYAIQKRRVGECWTCMHSANVLNWGLNPPAFIVEDK